MPRGFSPCGPAFTAAVAAASLTSRLYSYGCRPWRERGVPPHTAHRSPTALHARCCRTCTGTRMTPTATKQMTGPPAPAPIVLRSYQEESVLKALAGNTIVILPTGAGKTLIAAEAVLRLGPRVRALFLVPTVLLVPQQAAVVREWTGLKVGELRGGKSLPAEFDVLVCTPKAFELAQSLHRHLAWSSFHIIIFDEVHHVLKEHPYRQLATSLRYDKEQSARILGLTASLTYAVSEERVQAAMDSICVDLQIEHIYTASYDELVSAGYHATTAPAQVIQVPQDEQHSDPNTPNSVLPKAQRSPHLMLPTFFQRVERQAATHFALRLMQCIHAMEEAVTAAGAGSANPFSSPLPRLLMKEWGKYAQAHGSSLSSVCARGRQQGLYPVAAMCAQLEHWYEALKLLVVSWEEAEDAAVQVLRMGLASGDAADPAGEGVLAVWPPAVQEALRQFWAAVRPTYARLEHLKRILRAQLDARPDFRGILFVDQRIMTHVLQDVIARDPQLERRLRTACLYATGSPATTSLRVTPSQAKVRLADFGSGAVNLLISTVVTEEGMDVPAANCVIRFDPVLNAVSFVQGRGRARQADSDHLMLAERRDRPADLLQQVALQQDQLARSYQPTLVISQHTAKECAAQKSREVGAASLLSQPHVAGTACDTLAQYVRRTKALLTTHWEEQGAGQATQVCHMRYTSPLRDVEASGEAPSQPQASMQAALLMLEKLRAGATS